MPNNRWSSSPFKQGSKPLDGWNPHVLALAAAAKPAPQHTSPFASLPPVWYCCQCGVGHANPAARTCRACKAPRPGKQPTPAPWAAAAPQAGGATFVKMPAQASQPSQQDPPRQVELSEKELDDDVRILMAAFHSLNPLNSRCKDLVAQGLAGLGYKPASPTVLASETTAALEAKVASLQAEAAKVDKHLKKLEEQLAKAKEKA